MEDPGPGRNTGEREPMDEKITLTEKEALTAIVFGDTFALYDEKAFDEFVAPFATRFAENGINREVFRGKKCLDAGCGGGRGSIFMAQSGAREVTGVDLSPTNVASSRKRAAQKGFTNLHFEQQSLMDLPFEDESFDIVWCNGVLHHIADPDAGLREITRVLKKDGWMWLYLYGSGGIYWYTVDWIRETLHGVDVRDCIWHLRLMEMPVRRIAEWIDDWFVPYLRRYTREDATRRLDELGLDHTAPLDRGMGYDTSHRRIGAAAGELALMGDGDVRFFCHKAGAPRGDRYRLPDPPDGKGSPYRDGDAVTRFGPFLGELTTALGRLEDRYRGRAAVERILVARSVHSRVRTLLETPGPFDTRALEDHIGRLAGLLEEGAVPGAGR
jgi:ubiquinone/menaquinone biosynthesis C-methylase UbiE